jgi:flagellar hook-associated protein 3 FlgL
MRVTQNMTTRNFIGYIHRHADNLLKVQRQVASQKRINRISDDPVGMGQVLGYRSRLATTEQYQKNIDLGITRIEFNELTLDLASDLVGTARQLADEYSGSDFTAEERQFAAFRVKNLYDQVMQIANTKFNGNYIFSGHATDAAPFSRDADYNAVYHGDEGKFRIMIADKVEISIEADGSSIFQNAANGGVNIFDQLKNLIDGLENPDLAAGSAQIKATVKPLYDGREQIDNRRSEYAPVIYRLQATEEYLAHLKPKVEDAMASLEQADVTRAVVELQSLQLAYETTLATAAKIIQPHLLNFLG